jgi:hypothetical protein
MVEEIKYVETLLSDTREIKDYTLTISGNSISANINLTPTIDRQNNGEMDNTIIQTYLTDTITQELASAGFTI